MDLNLLNMSPTSNFRRTITVILSLLFLTTPAFGNDTNANEEVVRAFIEAYNSRDLDGMLKLTDPNIRWMSVTDTGAAAMTSNAGELEEAMAGYFSSPAITDSELLSIQVLGGTVTSVEKASWENAQGNPQSQCSVAVYLINEALIESVWYFPEQACP